jgi:7-carboxy-7-deazaguanine synthase
MKLTEVYTSIQGEGPNTGMTTTFIRFGGCNFRCPGWGTGTLPDGTVVEGCDTIFAVYPAWRHHWKTVTPEEVMTLVPKKVHNVCLTGGEPLIQKEIDHLVDLLVGADNHHIDLFTNGSIRLPWWAKEDFVTVVMDWKLPGSGERYETDFAPAVEDLRPKDVIKFTIKDHLDFGYAWGLVNRFRLSTLGPTIYFSPVWGKMNATELASLVQAANIPQSRFQVQLHKYLWDPNERER